ncbi:hypothetical protein DL96DRAFT_1686484 [Flagelloscypha sp. PMI_526]|nr:hypothetical protein DL96DRAFT_1686484 [Flagelloscypha sp. PMI_526]
MSSDNGTAIGERPAKRPRTDETNEFHEAQSLATGLGDMARDAAFWLDCTPVVFQAESTLFRVPKHRFVELSSVFRDMFSVPSGSHHQIEGISEEKPIIVQDSVEDFRALLSYLYPAPNSGRINHVSCWVSILSLSHKYQMESVLADAVKVLTVRDDVPRLTIFNLNARYGPFPNWKSNALRKFCQDEPPLSAEEMSVVGFEVGAQIAHIRELRLRNKRKDMADMLSTLVEKNR